MIQKYNTNFFKLIFFIFVTLSFSFPANSELSVEEIIKGRKALFSKNYSTAKKVQTFASKRDFDKAKKLIRVAGLSTTKLGAGDSMPILNELN